jgi:predicted nucleic acid-binding protein
VKKVDAFWDASALVPLCVAQGTSVLVRTAAITKSIAAWWGSPVEMTSAFARLLRNGEIDQQDFRLALARLTELRRRWIEVQPTAVLRELAVVALQRHPLRAGDAMQLAAALVWSKQLPRKRLFVCFDGRLADAASQEGFSVQTV